MDALPADCVRVALHDFRERIDWVLAGINAGGNLGVDIYYSGDRRRRPRGRRYTVCRRLRSRTTTTGC